MNAKSFKSRNFTILVLFACLLSLSRSQLEIPDDTFQTFEEIETPHIKSDSPSNEQKLTYKQDTNAKVENSLNKDTDVDYVPHHPGRVKSYNRPHRQNDHKHRVKDLESQEDVHRSSSKRRSSNNNVQEDLDLITKRRMNHDIEDSMHYDKMPHDDFERNMAGLESGMGMEGSRQMGGHIPGHPHMQGGGMGRQGMHGMSGRGGHQHNSMQSNNFQNNQHMNQNNNFNTPSSWMGSFGPIYEIMMLVFLAGLIFNCFCGNTHNDKYALAWYNANKQYFEERYEVIGLGPQEEDQLEFKMPDNSPLVKENPYFYKFFAANYRYVKWLMTVIEFRKRTDSVSLMTSFFLSNKDRLIYEVAINPTEEVGWMFCICKRRDAKALRKSYPDIDFFSNNYDPSIINDRLTVLSENIEIFMELFQNKNLLNYYKAVEPYVDVIYYTDQQTFCKDKYAFFFSFELHLNAKQGHERTLLEITHFVNLFVDTLAQVKYSDKAKKEFEKNRVMFERTKMEDVKRREIEEQEKRDFIENWKLRNKMKGKKMKDKKFKELKSK